MNRHDRRAADKGAKSKPSKSARQVPAPALLEGSPNIIETINPQGWYYHATVHDGTRERSLNNLTQEHVVKRIAVPFKLNQRFRFDGFDIASARVQRFKITRTAAPFNPAHALQSADMSSIGSAFISMALIGQQMTAAEDVTDDILIQAVQFISSEGLKAEPIGVLDTAVNHNKAFVVMSFAPEAGEAFDAMKDACEKCGIKAVRVDQEISSGPIMDRIIGHLKETKYVIADLTGARPNVYYEIGYFDALCEARSVDPAAHMLFVAKDIATDAHFDVRHRGIQQYSSAFALMKIVEKWLQQRKSAIVVSAER
jgi:hypothetical protein